MAQRDACTRPSTQIQRGTKYYFVLRAEEAGIREALRTLALGSEYKRCGLGVGSAAQFGLCLWDEMMKAGGGFALAGLS